MPPGSPSYVERAADRELFEALMAGEFCHVLNSRQMGKSSLAVRTIARLQEAGVRTAFVDLTRLGAAGATPEKWYAGLLMELGRALGERERAMAAVRAEGTPAGKLFAFLEDALSPPPTPSSSPGASNQKMEVATRSDEEGARIVVFIDEVDATRTLPFPADDLFAGVRQAWNARATDSAYGRLTFCLLGAALPSDLIHDPRMTPFNVGRRVELRDFTPEEARPFAGVVGEAALARVLSWTGGHPFLTQSLCAELASPPGPLSKTSHLERGSAPTPDPSPLTSHKGEGSVDALVRSRYLDARARETDTNLADVGRRLLGTGDPNVTDEDRATTLALYEKMLKGRPVQDDESSPAAARIKMSGVARVENGLLTPRNRIYEEAFDRQWVRANTPGHELRRQRRAFWKGALRAGAVGTAVAATIAALAVVATKNAERATRAEVLAKSQRDQARYDAYAASMQTMIVKQDDGDGTGARRTLERLRDDPARGWEWDYWFRAMVGASSPLAWNGRGLPVIAADPKGEWIGVADTESISFYHADGSFARRIELPPSRGTSYVANAYRHGDRFLVQEGSGFLALIIDARTGQVLKRKKLSGFIPGAGLNWNSVDDRWTLVVNINPTLKYWRVDLDTLEERPIETPLPASSSVWFSPRGDLLALLDLLDNSVGLQVRRTRDFGLVSATTFASQPLANFDPQGRTLIASDGLTLRRLDANTGTALWTVPFRGSPSGIQFSPDGTHVLITRTRGRSAQEFDVRGSQPRASRTFYDAWACLYTEEGEGLLAASDSVRRLDLRSSGPTEDFRLDGGPFRSLLRRGDGQALVIGKRQVFLLDPNDARRKPEAVGETRMGFDGSGRFSMEFTGNTIRFADVDRKIPSFEVPPPQQPNWSAVQASPDGRWLALADDELHLGMIRTATGKKVRRLDMGAFANLAGYSKDGRLLAVGNVKGGVSVWDLESWRRIGSAALGASPITIIEFSDDGRKIALGSEVGQLAVFDVSHGKLIDFADNAQAATVVAWSHDGRRLATIDGNGKVRIWDPATGRDLGTIGRHGASGLGLWFLPGNQALCSIDINGGGKVWATQGRF